MSRKKECYKSDKICEKIFIYKTDITEGDICERKK